MPSCPRCRSSYPEGALHCAEDGEPLLDDRAFSNVDRELAPGDRVGEYVIEGKIGEGGFGSVYAAVHPLIGKRAALKTLHRQHSSNPTIVARFIAEAKAVNQIRHRNIIDIFSFGNLPDGRQYFLMELLEGRTLDDFLRAKGKLRLDEALPILRDVARALDAAHAKGIAHRDLKPENIFLVLDERERGQYTAKLLDFGVAKLSSPEQTRVKTRTGAPIGTPYYMSPEQARGLNVDYRTDIYAIGVVCFQLLSGQVPFNGAVLMDVLMAQMATAPPRMSDLDPTQPRELDEPILHMLAKDPAQRPASVGAAIDELEAAGRRAGVLAGPAHAKPGNVTASTEKAGNLTPGNLTPGNLTPGNLTPGNLTPGNLTPGNLNAARVTPGGAAFLTGDAAGPTLLGSPAQSGSEEGLAHARTHGGSPRQTDPSVDRDGDAPSATARYGKAAALVASVMVVALVLVVFELHPGKAAPLVKNVVAPLPAVASPLASALGGMPTEPGAGAGATGSAAPVSTPGSTPGSASGPAAGLAPVTSAAPLAAIPSASPSVEVFVFSTPPAATVSREGEPLGRAPGPFAIPKSSEKVTLTASATGYQTSTVALVPDVGKSITVNLKKAMPSRAPISRDLADPFSK